MTRLMYDSISPDSIPADAVMVAGYADGMFANIPAMKARFPRAIVVDIAVKWTTRARVLDVETGDATPAQAVQWCTQTMSDTSNHTLTVYCNMDAWPSVRSAFQSAGVTEPNYWVARYDNDPTVPAGAVAKQYQGDTNGYDVSSVASYWPGVDPAPIDQPAWLKLIGHLLSVPEQIYETWVSGSGWNNVTQFGTEYGENGVSWCVIFDWDMFHDCGLDAIVPKTDNVDDFTSWAKQRGQWSDYPSIGAWVNFGNGAHTEIVTGFDAVNVYTKGGNSVQTGATDNGQGNGVWSHSHARTDPYVVGYFAPRFPDGVCPPTADPNDPRGGTAVTSYRATAPVQTEEDMSYWNDGQLTPGPDPLVVLPPSGSAWLKLTNRSLHLGHDALGAPADTAKVRVALHDGRGWSIQEVDVVAADGRVNIPFSPSVQKISLQTMSTGVAWAVEAW